VSAGLSIYDTMNFIKPDVSAPCAWAWPPAWAPSCWRGRQGQALCAAQQQDHDPPADRAVRRARPPTSRSTAREILKTREQLNRILAERTGQPFDKIASDTERDYFMSAGEALRLRPDRQGSSTSAADASSGSFSIDRRAGSLVYHGPHPPPPRDVPMADKKGGSSEKVLYCSFCGKSQHEVKKLIAGPSVFICDECIELCNDIIRDESRRANKPAPRRQVRPAHAAARSSPSSTST
jgi:hypothetical protein